MPTEKKYILVVDFGKLCNRASVEIDDVIDTIIIGPRSQQNELILQKYISGLGHKRLAEKVRKSSCTLK